MATLRASGPHRRSVSRSVERSAPAKRRSLRFQSPTDLRGPQVTAILCCEIRNEMGSKEFQRLNRRLKRLSKRVATDERRLTRIEDKGFIGVDPRSSAAEYPFQQPGKLRSRLSKELSVSHGLRLLARAS